MRAISLELDPEHEGASAALADLTGEARVERQAEHRRWAVAAAALLLAMAGWFVYLRRRRDDDEMAEQEQEQDPEPVIETMDTAPDTLPG